MASEIQLRVSWRRRFFHWIVGWFRPTIRSMTSIESDLQDEVNNLKDLVASLRDENKSLRNDLELADTRQKVSQVEIDGMAAIIARHEKHWEAEQAIQSARVAKAEMLSRSDIETDLDS